MTTTLTDLIKSFKDEALKAKEVSGNATVGPWATVIGEYPDRFGTSNSVAEYHQCIYSHDDAYFITKSRTLVPNQADTILRLCEMLARACKQRDILYGNAENYISPADELSVLDQELLAIAQREGEG